MKHRAQMSLFLQAMKRFAFRDGILLIEREVSMSFLSQRGMTMGDLTAIVLSLTPSDCFDGPEPDRDPCYAEHWTVAEFAPIFKWRKAPFEDVDPNGCAAMQMLIRQTMDREGDGSR